MTHQGRWPRRFVGCLLAFGTLAAMPGCLSFVHPLGIPPPEQLAPAYAIPAPCRHRVHIFLLHGMDPLDLANLTGLTEYINALGYLKTHYGQMVHLWEFKKEMRRIHKDDPEVRFVLIGFSFGANIARELANSVKDDGILIDLLIYLGGNTLENTPRNQPENVVRILNILALGCIWNGAQLDRAENIQYRDVLHFGSPTHPQTREMLARELAIVAGRVPFIDNEPPVEEAPPPRPLSAQNGQKMPELAPEWSFLEVRKAYGEAPPPALAQPSRTSSIKRVPFAMRP